MTGKQNIYSLLAVPEHFYPHQGAIKSPGILMSKFDCGRNPETMEAPGEENTTQKDSEARMEPRSIRSEAEKYNYLHNCMERFICYNVQ